MGTTNQQTAAAVCSYCRRNPARPGWATCVACSHYFRVQARSRSAKLRAAGLCSRCGKEPPRPGKRTCSGCELYFYEHRQERNRRRKAHFRDWLRRQPCCLGDCDAPYSDPAHVRSRGAGGRERGNLVPLCRHHHDEFHRAGRLTFALTHGVELGRLALEYAARYRRLELDRLPF